MYINIDDVNAWLEDSKLSLTDLDDDLEAQVSSLVISRLRTIFDVSTWNDDTDTPRLVRTIIAMEYTAWLYDQAYSDDAEANAYARLLRTYAEANISGLLAGDLILDEDPDAVAGVGQPTFFPNDNSSANKPTTDFPSDGPPYFMMGTTF